LTKKLKYIKKECFWCKVNPPKRKINDRFKIVALDRPYINLWFHHKCYSRLNEKELLAFLNETQKIWDKKV